MEANPLISVIIPTYRRASMVGRAIESVRRQSYANLEILVIDDGSPDNTGDVVRAIPDPRIRYLRHAQNKGLPAGRNTGIRAANGNYIAFLDDDDEWRPDKIARQLVAIADYDAVLCAAVSNDVILRNHKRSVVTLADLRRGSFDPSSLLARATVLRDVWFDERLTQGEDWDAFIRIAENYSIGWVSEPLLIYNTGNHDRMTTRDRTMYGPEFEKRIAMLRKHRAFFGERWYHFHVARALLGYIGSRQDKAACVWHAVRRCGIVQVIAVLGEKLVERVRHRWIIAAARVKAASSNQDVVR